jgi:ABC-type glycerol-3-phosphate transport system substrate-binding protein
MVDDGIAPSDVAALGQNDVFDGLAGGAYAMVLGGTWGRGMLDKQSTFADRMVALPVPGTGRRHGVTLLGGWSFVLAPTAKPGTAEFLMTLFGDVFQAKKLRERRYLPTHRAVLSDPWFTAHPDGATFRLALDRSLAMPLHPAAAEMLDVVATMLAETFLRRKSPPEAADDAARKIEALNQQR